MHMQWRSGLYCVIAVVFAGGPPIASGQTDQHWIEIAHYEPGTPTVGGHFGRSVAIHDDMLLVGAPYRGLDPFTPLGPGAAQLSAMPNESIPVESRRVLAPDGEEGDLFGAKVCLGPIAENGDALPIAFVSAPRRSCEGGDVMCGAVYSYLVDESQGVSWLETIVPLDTHLGQMFGTSLDFDGRTLAVGAHREDLYGQAVGCVYLYTIDENGMTQDEVRIDPRWTHPDQYFGFSVAIDGDRLAVGAFADPAVSPLAGSVHLYERQPDGSWRGTVVLYPEDVASGDLFGTSVALVGDTLVAGASGRRVQGLPSVGRVYVFNRSGADWVQTQMFDPPIVASSVYWGTAVDLQEDLLVIGGNGWVNNGVQTGAVSVYASTDASGFELVQTILAGGIEDQGGFGVSVDCEGMDVVVGAPAFGSSDGGSAHAFAVTCLGDLDGDHDVAVADVMEIIGHWSESGIHPADLTQDFEIGVEDLLAAAGNWGPCP